MWDDTKSLTAIANTLLVIGLLLILHVVLNSVVRLPAFALREIEVGGDLAHFKQAQAEELAKHELRGNFFTIDLADARKTFEKLPWIKRAQVRRQWPDRLLVTLEEHVPLARWNDTALIDADGEIFDGESDAELPTFVGPLDAARDIVRQYAVFQEKLATIKQVPVHVELSPRQAWQLRLASGLTLLLGRYEIEARLGNFIAAYDDSISYSSGRLDYVDLRYANGFAMRLRNGS